MAKSQIKTEVISEVEPLGHGMLRLIFEPPMLESVLSPHVSAVERCVILRMGCSVL